MITNPAKSVLTMPNPSNQKINKRAAFHVAGHAAAIYLGNNQRKLPPVYFRIGFHQSFLSGQSTRIIERNQKVYFPKLEGGRLISELPFSFTDEQKFLHGDQKLAYQRAFEADIINFLAGPIAEAKYVAIRDDELISPRLLNLKSLHNYGGETAIEVVNRYFECIKKPDEDKNRLIIDLYYSAFAFVNERANWLAITALADHITAKESSHIECEEIISILKNACKEKKLIH